MEFYIDAKNEVADDILFFVRQFVPSYKSSTGSINDLDPVLVKRRVAGQTPALNDVIDWKQSFFLNLICQIPCTLTVTICRKEDTKDRRVIDPACAGNDKKSTMKAFKRITKKVYASPYKSRMDAKDALMNECSYPLVYYTVNDYQNETLHLSIEPGEYLCAELSITIPEVASTMAYVNATKMVAEISIEDNPDPFPVPQGYSKVVLFQGAVGFKALSDVYVQKGIAAMNQMKHSWARRDTFDNPRTEYILMRGPHGKGQCQGKQVFKAVAIQVPDSPDVPPPPPSYMGFLRESIRSSLSTSSATETTIDPPRSLECSMTYVNVPWHSIASDLLANLKLD